ncbi:MBL fold metallo-hydrolase [Methanogenium organophilum]|uniref:MBL fold metallo-hydrolase n=1 Tax=Methanogenium organophilum TaxID=2199 RepID=A0A9X9S4F7_METOG|nr:MBL fold metallo-hydrolase [Methanogenium organophilum]WAI01759.1 MBL fold metallo-hydrolase [Methanogenium organophilum]
MPVHDIRIIKPGSILIDAFEVPASQTIAMKKRTGIGGGSTVTYLASDKTVLVDTGYDYEENTSAENRDANRQRLIHCLMDAGLTPQDIDIVFITHWHADHFMNLSLFPESEVICSEAVVQRHGLAFTGVADKTEIADGIRVCCTPGHTVDHASLLVTTEPLRYRERTQSGGSISGIGSVTVAVAGDAIIDAAYYCTEKFWDYNADFYSHEAARTSSETLSAQADFIIPGHGTLFRNIRKDESMIARKEQDPNQ